MAEEKAGPSNAPEKNDAPVKDGEQQQAPEKKVYPQEEVDRIVAKVRRNAARDAELRFRREQGSQHQEPAREQRQDPAKEEAEPKRDDFETHEDYQRALTRYDAKAVAREERLAAEKETKEKAAREQNEKAASTWQGKIVRAQTKLADFEDVLEDNSDLLDLIANSPMPGFITQSDIGPQIIYELCKNPAEAKRILALPGYKQAAEITKIEDRLTAAGKPAKNEGEEEHEEDDTDTDAEREQAERDSGGRFKPKKDAPKTDEPIEPVGARPANASSEPSDKDDAATWHRKRVAQLARRRNPGK